MLPRFSFVGGNTATTTVLTISCIPTFLIAQPGSNAVARLQNGWKDVSDELEIASSDPVFDFCTTASSRSSDR